MAVVSESKDRTVALVTGAAQGIGLGIARSLVMAGYRVALADIEQELVVEAAVRLRGGGSLQSEHPMRRVPATGGV